MSGLRHLSGDLLENDGKIGDDANLVASQAGNSSRDEQTKTANGGNANGDVPENHSDDKKDKNDAGNGGKSVDSKCGGCMKEFDGMRAKCSIKCVMCESWFCVQCSTLKKTELLGAVISRSDVFWACGKCATLIPKVTRAAKAQADSNPTEAIDHVDIGKIHHVDIAKIQGCIESTIKETLKKELIPAVEECFAPVKQAVEDSVRETVLTEIPPVVKTCIEPVNKMVEDSIAKTWANFLFPDFPEIGSPEFQNAPKKPKLSLTAALKRANTEIRRDESRLTNVIIHRATESRDPNPETRSQSDQTTVSEILDHIGVAHRPVKFARLGQYSQDDQTRPRPIKVVFKDSAEQGEVISRAHKLMDAPESIKNVSICYDMTKEEQETCRDLVKEAKNLTKDSTTHRFKVVGRPGEMEVKPFPLRPTRQATELEFIL